MEKRIAACLKNCMPRPYDATVKPSSLATSETSDADTDPAPAKESTVPAHAEVDLAVAGYVATELDKAINKCRRDLEEHMSVEIASLRSLYDAVLSQDSDQTLGRCKPESVGQEQLEPASQETDKVAMPAIQESNTAEVRDVAAETASCSRADPGSEVEPQSSLPLEMCPVAESPDSDTETIMGHIIELHLRADDLSRKYENMARAFLDVSNHMHDLGYDVRSLGRRSLSDSCSEGPSDTDVSDRHRGSEGHRRGGRRLPSLDSQAGDASAGNDGDGLSRWKARLASRPPAKTETPAAPTVVGSPNGLDKRLLSASSSRHAGTPRGDRGPCVLPPYSSASLPGTETERAPVATLGRFLDPTTRFHSSALPIRNRAPRGAMPSIEQRPGSITARV